MVARNRVVISGTIAGSIERWSCSCDFTLSGGGSVTNPGDLTTWADNIANALDAGETNWPSITTMMGANVNATRVDVYGYGSTGPAVASGSATFAWNGLGTIRVPFSTSICVTKQTGMSGRSRRGRFYWPALAVVMNSDGSCALDTDIADEFASLLVAMTDIDGIVAAVPVVTSQVLNQVMDITSVRVGDVPDTQRSRRESVAESYETATV